MKRYFQLMVVALFALVVGGCHGYVDPATLPQEQPTPNPSPTDGELTLVADKSAIVGDGEQMVTFSVYCSQSEDDDTNEPVVDEQLPIGVIRIYADKTSVSADGTDYVQFTVLYGTDEGNLDISEGPTTRLVYTYNGEETQLGYGVSRFSTTTPGTYVVKATAYRGGNLTTDNEITIVAQNSNTSGLNFYHKQLGMQFTSTGCQNCPELSRVIKAVQANIPGRMVAVSFHEDFKVVDPMTLPISTKYHSHLAPDGLPRFALNMRPGDLGAYQSGIERGIENHIANYPPTCGVAIDTEYDDASRNLTIRSKIISATATVYRYEVMIVEDGIVAEQLGQSGDYTHNNVVRQVLSGSITGARFNLGSALEPGAEYTEERVVTIPDGWNEENLRVVVIALTSPDGGESYVANNCNECKAGQSVDFEYVDNSEAAARLNATRVDGDDVTANATIRCITTGETLNGNSFTATAAGTYEFEASYKDYKSNIVKISVTAANNEEPEPPVTGDTKNFVRHIAVMEFTGTWCTWCPDGYSLLTLVLKSFNYTERAHILALHDKSGGEDPMGLPLTNEINNAFGPVAYPGFLIDLRDAGEIGSNSSGIRNALKRSDNEFPAHAGVALSTTYDESSKSGKITARVFSNTDDTYRIALYILEDGIIASQKSGSIVIDNYAHDHVVRQMLSASYKGDRVGDLVAGQEVSVEYDFTLSAEAAEKCSVCAMIIDGTGYVNNVNVCPLVDGAVDYDVVEE